MDIIACFLILLALISIIIMVVLLSRTNKMVKNCRKNKKLLLKTYLYMKISIFAGFLFMFLGISLLDGGLYLSEIGNFIIFLCIAQYLSNLAKKTNIEDNEEIVFGFKAENSDKVLSISVLKNSQEYMICRFGNEDNIEIEFPENITDSWSKFTYSYYLRGGENEKIRMDMNYIKFENDGYEYEIYQEYTSTDNFIKIGVRIKEKLTNKEIDIKGLTETLVGSLMEFRKKYYKIKIEKY